MNTTTLTGSDAVLTPLAPLEAVRRPVQAKRSVLIGGLLLGLLSAWTFDGGALGLGFFLVTLAFSVLLGTANRKEGWQSARSHKWLLAAAVLLASFAVIRDSGMLLFFDVIGVTGLLALAARGWNGDLPVADVSMKDLTASPFVAVGQGVKTGAAAISSELHRSKLSESWPKLFAPLAKMTLIGGPIVGVVTLLLASGDAAFEAQLDSAVNQLVGLPVPQVVRMGMVGAWTFTLAVGLVTWALRRRSLSGSEQAVAPKFQLGLPEAFSILGGLTLVLVLFSLVSARCAFAPDSCTLPPGVTYSKYAREGFWQLLAVAGIVLMTVLSVPHRAKIVTATQGLAVKLGASVLVAATLPMLLSAVNRMMLYEDVYGFTRQRVLSQVICVFVALLLVWRAVTVWAWPQRFALGFVAAGVLVLTGFNAMNPDAFIAKKNIAREGHLDTWYLRELSADAAGVLRQIPEERLEQYDRTYFATYRSAPENVSSFNLARACDRAGGAPLQSVLCP